MFFCFLSCQIEIGDFLNKNANILEFLTKLDEINSVGSVASDGSFMIHRQNLKALVVKMYKITYKWSPEFMWDMVEEINAKYHTRSSCNIDYNENNETVHTKKSNYRLKRQTQPRLDFNNSDRSDLRYGP